MMDPKLCELLTASVSVPNSQVGHHQQSSNGDLIMNNGATLSLLEATVSSRDVFFHICQGYFAGTGTIHDVVIKWKHFPRYWPFVRGIHRSPVNSPHEGQWRGALIFSLIRVWINGWVNNRGAGGLRRHRAHYDVIVVLCANEADSMDMHKIGIYLTTGTHNKARTACV